jgi:hypothetical protein
MADERRLDAHNGKAKFSAGFKKSEQPGEAKPRCSDSGLA